MTTPLIKTLLFGFMVSLLCLSSLSHAYVEPEAAQNAKTKAKNTSKAGTTKNVKAKVDKENDRKQPGYAKDRLIVKYKKNTGNRLADTKKFNARKSKLKVDGDHRRLKRLGKSKRTEVLQVPEGSDIQELVGLYSSDPNVEYAEPDFAVTALLEPNDPSFSQLWGMQNTGQAQNEISSSTPDADINAPEGWDITTGNKNVVVAVVDSGIFYTHPELADNMWVNPGEIPDNGIDDDNNGYIDDIHGINTLADHGDPMDDQGHGTHVSGTIGARGNNGVGVAGVSWNVSLIGCKFLDRGPGVGYISDAVECLDYLLDLKTRSVNPVDIVATNNSWGGGGYSQALSDAILAHEQAGILFIAAAGNSTNNNDGARAYPASYPHLGIISVAATDWRDLLASFSNYGYSSVDVAAPGVLIKSTVPIQHSDSECRLCNESGYRDASGTSMAAPHVTGLVALLKAQDPSRDLLQLRNLVLTSGTPLPHLQDITVSGRRIRAANHDGTGALTCADQSLLRKISPNTEVLAIAPNSQVNFQIAHLNCDSFGEEPSITVTPANEEITLKDDGQNADEIAGDGIFSATYAPQYGDVFSFPDGSEISTDYIQGYGLPEPTIYSQIPDLDYYYYPELIRYNYARVLNEAAVIDTDFPIPFGGVSPGYTRMYVNSNGTISFDGPATGDNGTLPYANRQSLIAPFWDNLTSGLAHNGLDIWAVTAFPVGQSPNRRFIVKFEPMSHAEVVIPGVQPDTIKFQVIFMEESPDIVFNYEDVDINGNGMAHNFDPRFSKGASATIGIQVAPDMYKHYSVNTPSIASGTAIRWKLSGVQADAGKDSTVASSEQAWLDGSESLGKGGISQYQWRQISGTPVTLVNANSKRASFTAPAKDTLEFELKVTDAIGATASDRVIIKTSARPIVNAGPDQFPIIDTTAGLMRTINLDGSTSSDLDGRIVRYQWVILNEPQMVLPNPTNAKTSLSIGYSKTLQIQLTVTDDAGLQASDIVVINPNARPVSKPWTGAEAFAPLGTAYTRQTYRLAGSAQDLDGQVVSYRWQQVSGPTVQISNANQTEASFVAPSTPTQLSFKLVSTDNEGATSSDQLYCFGDYCFPNNLVTINVVAAP